MIATTGLRHSLVWFVNDRLTGAEDLPDWASAVRRAAEIRQTLAPASQRPVPCGCKSLEDEAEFAFRRSPVPSQPGRQANAQERNKLPR